MTKRFSIFANVKIALCLGAMLFLLFSCKKFVQVAPPNNQVVTSVVYNNSSTVTAALLSIYNSMYSAGESWAMAQNQGLLSDELRNYASSTTQKEFYTNSMLAVNGPGDWKKAYNYIYRANDLIEGLQNNGNIFPEIAQQVVGEAKFIRAFWLFYLTNMYGNIPIITTTSYTINSIASRAPKTQVYQQIVKDLVDAQSLLNSNYVDASDTATTSDRIRPNKSTAQAMLARVYLYAGNYDSAKIMAGQVISNTNLYTLCNQLSNVFLMNSSEAIWQLGAPSPIGLSNTIDAGNFYLLSAPSTGGTKNVTISTTLLNSFEPSDRRMSNWIGVYPSATASVKYYFPAKYKSHNTSVITEYTMVLRLAEQYLIRAEAEAKLGDSGDAIADLNVIRTRAGLNPYSGATDQASLLTAILHERQVELFTEWGHRWFDLVRTGTANSVLGPPGNICLAKGGSGWSPNWQLYPIPSSEILNDPNLVQNSGY